MIALFSKPSLCFWPGEPHIGRWRPLGGGSTAPTMDSLAGTCEDSLGLRMDLSLRILAEPPSMLDDAYSMMPKTSYCEFSLDHPYMRYPLP